MTHCNSSPIVFSSFGRRPVVADFTGGAITSDAGALLLRQVDRKLALVDQIDGVIPDPRNPALLVHQQVTMLRQRIFAIAMGYEDGNDHQTLRDDPLMQLLTERGIDPDQPLASPPTLCRLENRILRRTLADIAAVFVEVFIQSHPTPPKELILDFDATDDPVHGNQINRFFHGYYDQYCFLPLYVFAGDHLLCAYLRPANLDPAHHAWAILSLLVQRLRQQWPDVKIIFRGDSGFCRWKMLRWCEKHGVFYIVGLARNSRLQEMARPLMEQAEAAFQNDPVKQRLFGQIDYAAYTWDKQRRVIVKAERLEQGPNLRFVVTNLDGEPQALYDDLYCQRGEMENRIKEQQLGLFADRTSCHDFVANQFRVLLSAAAYVLLQHLRQEALAGTELAEAQVPTLRVKLLKIGGLLKRSARRIVLHLAGGYPMQELFRRVAAYFTPTISTA
jgi:Transposase DDE domain group 1